MVWAHARAQQLCLSGWRVYYTTSRDTPSRLRIKQALTGPDIYRLTVTRAQTLENTELATYYSGDSPRHQPCLAALYGIDCLSVRAAKSVSLVSRASHLLTCLFHASSSGAIIAAAIANHRRLSQQNRYETRVSLIELGRISRNFRVHFEKIPTKSSSGTNVVPTYWVHMTRYAEMSCTTRSRHFYFCTPYHMHIAYSGRCFSLFYC